MAIKKKVIKSYRKPSMSGGTTTVRKVAKEVAVIPKVVYPTDTKMTTNEFLHSIGVEGKAVNVTKNMGDTVAVNKTGIGINATVREMYGIEIPVAVIIAYEKTEKEKFTIVFVKDTKNFSNSTRTLTVNGTIPITHKEIPLGSYAVDAFTEHGTYNIMKLKIV